jgi:hypothetical protein
MAYYNIRDLIGHFVKPRSAEGKMCPHACCRNKRVHPENYPVILPDRLLKRASDEDLAEGYNTGNDERRAQIVYEMERRDRRDARREAAEERRRERWTARRMERQELIEMSYVQAEAATRGHMLNRRGRDADIDPRSLFTGPESRARKYASEELLNHWQDHPRPTEAMLQGRDTRIHYSDPGARRRAA